MPKQTFNQRITSLQGNVKDYDDMKRQVEKSWIIWFSGLKEPLLFFFQCFEQWQQSRNEMFKDLAQGGTRISGETRKALAALQDRIKQLEEYRNELQKTNTEYLIRALKAEEVLAKSISRDGGEV